MSHALHRRAAWTALAPVLVVLLSGCASFRSDLDSAYEGPATRNPDPAPVRVAFVFSHVRQTLGLDAVPKLVPKTRNVSGFDEILGDALPELSNLGPYTTWTEEAGDVNRPERRAVRDSLMRAADYTVKVRLESSRSFTRQFLGGLLSGLSLTALPVPYTSTYTLKADVLDRGRRPVASYTRRARLTTWVELGLVVVYPFHPAERKREEIYMDFLHDVFRQIESEGVLKAVR